MKSLCGSGGFLYPCPENEGGSRNPPVAFGPFGLPVSPEIADDMLPVYGPEEWTPTTTSGVDDVPVWDVTGFSEFLTEYKTKRAAQDGVEPRGKASPRLWWILAAVAAFILWKA